MIFKQKGREKLRLCCIADLHIGLKNYSKIDPVTHFYSRELEILDNFKKIVQMCIDDKLDALLIAGDIYHSSLSSPTLQDEVNKILFYASQSHLNMLILDGNHDLKKGDKTVSALKPTETFSLQYIIHTQYFLDTELILNKETCRFIFLPTYTSNEELKELLDKNLPENNDYKNPIVVIGHFTMQKAELNDWLVAENEEFIDINLICSIRSFA